MGWTIEQGVIEALEAAGRMGPSAAYWRSLLTRAYEAGKANAVREEAITRTPALLCPEPRRTRS